ncbi:MAG: putative DNA binding domain-containing protein [Chloroflexota bacterium]|nr:putative DNA binding domain-containing protein [Chloroflexota bacterium]
MTDSEFIRGGEGPRLAFVDSANTVQIAENMVAFANTEGGVIVVGLQSDGNPGAVPPEFSEIDRVLKQADELYNPPVITERLEQVHFQTIEDRADPPSNPEATERIAPSQAARKLPAYALRVPRSTELHALSDGRVLIRSGKVNRPLGGQEILRLASAKNTGDFEGEAAPGATVEDFSREMIDEYLEKRAERTKRPYDGEINNLLAEVGAITADGKPTVCGLLLFSEYPQKWLPQSGVVFAKFVGTTPRGDSGLAGYTRREELTGPVPRLIEATWNLVWSEMAVSAVVKGLEREETFEYPQFAVREALVNAVCHRDYRLRGRRIEVRMFSDRLEVISPGGLPGFITVENIKDEHFSRNPRLVGGLFQWGYIEELGLGIDRMIEVMEQAGHSPPKFDARPYSFALALHNERKKPKPPEWSRDTNHRQARALQYIRENGSITNREFRGLINAVSAETLRLDLVDMVDKGILTKIGAKKGTYYVLREKR